MNDILNIAERYQVKRLAEKVRMIIATFPNNFLKPVKGEEIEENDTDGLMRVDGWFNDDLTFPVHQTSDQA